MVAQDLIHEEIKWLIPTLFVVVLFGSNSSPPPPSLTYHSTFFGISLIVFTLCVAGTACHAKHMLIAYASLQDGGGGWRNSQIVVAK